ncbi:hypothetical protein [Leptospira brenneri]|uniref:Uncharacterized protein n=1 Tax=Leptospira brenneri TaxID=2023182 RepID=A0A2M9XX87_9LEPT|nr:hypothetical protein [Leptospira brenneri]PJZ43904.1 hypothetical protein CH361_18035 [Leptospira brenneri]TGK93011.1 hypothetical protein EHQ30_12345 [Leptospira brenneri]
MKYDVILTFDLKDASSEAYTKAKKLLEGYGLHDTSISKDLPLPNTVLMGRLNYEIEASEIKDFVWHLFKENGLTPSRLMGGVLQDWSIKIKG